MGSSGFGGTVASLTNPKAEVAQIGRWTISDHSSGGLRGISVSFGLQSEQLVPGVVGEDFMITLDDAGGAHKGVGILKSFHISSHAPTSYVAMSQGKWDSPLFD